MNKELVNSLKNDLMQMYDKGFAEGSDTALTIAIKVLQALGGDYEIKAIETLRIEMNKYNKLDELLRNR